MSLITQVFTVLNLTKKQDNDQNPGVEKVFTSAVEAYDYVQNTCGSVPTMKYDDYKHSIMFAHYCTICAYNEEGEKIYYKIQVIDL